MPVECLELPFLPQASLVPQSSHLRRDQPPYLVSTSTSSREVRRVQRTPVGLGLISARKYL